MADPRVLRQLIKAGVEHDADAFRRAAREVIADERTRRHHLLANELENLLDPRGDAKRAASTGMHAPVDREHGVPLVEIRAGGRDLDDLALSPDLRARIDELIEFHRRRDVLATHGLTPPSRLLFFGPPGCGKTTAASAIATALGTETAVIRFDAIASSLLGESAANLRQVFEYLAREPVVAFFDEVDALATSRDHPEEHGEHRRVVNALLQFMDARRDGLLIAATNHESLLDAAAWRRFDEVFHFGLPDAMQVERLLLMRLRVCRHDVDVPSLAARACAAHLSHADIDRAVTRAMMRWVVHRADRLTHGALETALAQEEERVTWQERREYDRAEPADVRALSSPATATHRKPRDGSTTTAVRAEASTAGPTRTGSPSPEPSRSPARKRSRRRA